MLGRLTAALVCALAVEAAAADARLVLGPEISIGPAELGAWPPWVDRSSIASDGDDIFIAFAGGPPNWSDGLYAVLIDRHGNVLTPAPLLLQSRDELSPSWPVALWAGGHYVVFFTGHDGMLYATRVSREGEVIGRTRIVDAPKGVGLYDAATNGEEIVLVTAAGKIVILHADLTTAAVVDGAAPSVATAVAYGGGRYAIVAEEKQRVTSRYLERGRLGPAVVIAEANAERGASDVAWNGSGFVAAWTECGEDDCLSWLARLDGAGATAGSPRAILRERLDYIEPGHGVTVTPLDGETVFVTSSGWVGKAKGRRFRGSVPVDPDWIDLGHSFASAFATAHGALVVADGTVSVALIDAPATAPLASPLPLTPMARTTANEEVASAAASPTAIAILRRTWRSRWHEGLGTISVMSRDGTLLREIPTEAMSGALASDGRDLYALTVDRKYRLLFWRVEPGAAPVQVPSGEYPTEVSLAWTGSEFLAVWRDRSGMRIQRIGRDGAARGATRTLEGSIPKLVAEGGTLLLTWHAATAMVARLASDGSFIGEPEPLPVGAAFPHASSNGRTEGVVFRHETSLRLALREMNAAFVAGPALVQGDWRDYLADPVLAATGSLFIAAYEHWTPNGSRTEVMLLDERGVRLDETAISSGAPIHDRANVLLPLDDGTVLAVYSRIDERAPYRGTWRTFARILGTTTAAPPARRRAVR